MEIERNVAHGSSKCFSSGGSSDLDYVSSFESESDGDKALIPTDIPKVPKL